MPFIRRHVDACTTDRPSPLDGFLLRVETESAHTDVAWAGRFRPAEVHGMADALHHAARHLRRSRPHAADVPPRRVEELIPA